MLFLFLPRAAARNAALDSAWYSQVPSTVVFILIGVIQHGVVFSPASASALCRSRGDDPRRDPSRAGLWQGERAFQLHALHPPSAHPGRSLLDQALLPLINDDGYWLAAGRPAVKSPTMWLGRKKPLLSVAAILAMFSVEFCCFPIFFSVFRIPFRFTRRGFQKSFIFGWLDEISMTSRRESLSCSLGYFGTIRTSVFRLVIVRDESTVANNAGRTRGTTTSCGRRLCRPLEPRPSAFSA